MDTDLDTLATALYVTADDLLKTHPEQLPERPVVGIVPSISDAELIVLAVMQALLVIGPKPAGYAGLTRTFTPCFPICRASRATTSG